MPAGSEARRLVDRVARRAHTALLTEAWCLALAAVCGAVILLVVLDFAFRLPRGVRVLHLAALGYGVYVLARRVVLPAVRFRPTASEVALRIERADEAARARDRLASGLELARPSGTDASNGLTKQLAAQAVAGADSVAKQIGETRFVRTRSARRAAGLLAAVVIVVAGTGLAAPGLASIGLRRTLMPLGDTAWPKRTAVADATGVKVHPIGEPLSMRALLTKTNLPAGKSEVVAFYRLHTTDGAGSRQRVVLTAQGRGAVYDGAEGELYERLIEPGGTLAEGDEIEYWFETSDNRSVPARVRLAERPRVTRLSATVRPPAYAEQIRGAFLAASDLPLSRDAGGVAVLQPVLAGSAFEIRVWTNKPTKVADASAAGWSVVDDSMLVFTGNATDRQRVELELIDNDGLVGIEPLAVVLEVTNDAPAAVTITEPPYDESVLATALIGVRAEAEDDLGLRWLVLEREHAARPAGSEGAGHEGSGELIPLGRAEPRTGEQETGLVVDTSLDLSRIGVRAGDEVWLSATGRDVYAAGAEGESAAREVRSATRRLRIIDEAAFVGQLQGELTGVRRAAIEIDGAQKAILDAQSGRGLSAEQAEAQASLTERLEAQRAAVERLQSRTARNGLSDETLNGILEDAAALLRDAAGASDEATSELEREAENAAADAESAQQEVRENLASLISMLDQGQDNWVARRTVESLLAEQREIAAETRALGEQTMGRSMEQLSQEELSELERIAERQRDAAERARRALDSLAERSESLERFDAAQAQAMSDAARRGRQERLEQQMQEAAAQLDQNQTQAAAQGQQAAEEALEQMLEDIDSADEARDEALRRVLATVLDALEALIEEQEAQLDALALSRDNAEIEALADPMVRLATNTLGLLDEIGAQRDLATVTSLVGLAADAQERAVSALREASMDSADDAERESLSKLQDARAEAKRQEEEAEDRESARKRAELREAYRELLEMQVAVVTATEPLVGAELDRRARARVRAVGQRQEGVGEALAELQDSTEELAETAVFDLAHRRIAGESDAAAAQLRTGEADAVVLRRQGTVVRLLQALLESLAEENGSGREGGSQSGGSGGSGGQTPIVPEIAELKLLRTMQAEVMEWTRNIDESGQRPAADELDEVAGLQADLAERAEALIEKLTQGQAGPGEVQEGRP